MPFVLQCAISALCNWFRSTKNWTIGVVITAQTMTSVILLPYPPLYCGESCVSSFPPCTMLLRLWDLPRRLSRRGETPWGSQRRRRWSPLTPASASLSACCSASGCPRKTPSPKGFPRLWKGNGGKPLYCGNIKSKTKNLDVIWLVVGFLTFVYSSRWSSPVAYFCFMLVGSSSMGNTIMEHYAVNVLLWGIWKRLNRGIGAFAANFYVRASRHKMELPPTYHGWCARRT